MRLLYVTETLKQFPRHPSLADRAPIVA